MLQGCGGSYDFFSTQEALWKASKSKWYRNWASKDWREFTWWRLVSGTLCEGTEPYKKTMSMAGAGLAGSQRWKWKSTHGRADGTHGLPSLKSTSLSRFPVSVNDDNIHPALLTRSLEDIFNHPIEEIPYPFCHFAPEISLQLLSHAAIPLPKSPFTWIEPSPPDWIPWLRSRSLPFHFPQSSENDLFKM